MPPPKLINQIITDELLELLFSIVISVMITHRATLATQSSNSHLDQ